jgi:hypothetical protein
LQKGCPFFGFVKGAALIDMILEVIRYSLPTAPESIQDPLAKDERIVAALGQMYAFLQNLPIPLEKFLKGLSILSDT